MSVFNIKEGRYTFDKLIISVEDRTISAHYGGTAIMMMSETPYRVKWYTSKESVKTNVEKLLQAISDSFTSINEISLEFE